MTKFNNPLFRQALDRPSVNKPPPPSHYKPSPISITAGAPFCHGNRITAASPYDDTYDSRPTHNTHLHRHHNCPGPDPQAYAQPCTHRLQQPPADQAM